MSPDKSLVSDPNTDFSHRVATSEDLEIGTYLQIAEERTTKPDEHKEELVTNNSHPDSETIIVLDFGSQFSQLIVRRVRENNVYAELLPHDTPFARIQELKPRAFILSGGPNSVYEDGAPQLPDYVLASGLPVLGICYGMQLLTHALGGKVAPSAKREFGPATIQVKKDIPLFAGLPSSFGVWMSHGDRIEIPPLGFETVATSENSPCAAMINQTGSQVAIQFHPEVVHTPLGKEILHNFLFNIVGCRGTWSAGSFIDQAIGNVRARVGQGRVLCALSGGVDSAVVATLLHKAIGDQLTCIFVDNGLLRKNEAAQVVATFKDQQQINLIHIDATERFLNRLAGVVDPEMKRRIIGEEFIRIFEAEALKIGQIDFLAQGTLYPDVIESTSSETKAANRIKTHHNVGGLPKDMKFQLIEPLRFLFKDEVRQVGLSLGLPPEIIWRHPFPGPGLAIRVIGEVNAQRLATLREADAILREEIVNAGLFREIWQTFAVLTPLKSVGVMGDGRTYADVVALRAVSSEDGMTADWSRLPYELLAKVSNRIVNEVPGVNRIVYDITSKPPATIEWE